MQKRNAKFLVYVLAGLALIACGSAAKTAVANITAKSGSTVSGTATFTGEGGKVTMRLDVAGAPPGPHAVHLHTTGDCSGADGLTAGAHWNPHTLPHGELGKGENYHLGDIGNFDVGADGKGSRTITTDKW